MFQLQVNISTQPKQKAKLFKEIFFFLPLRRTITDESSFKEQYANGASGTRARDGGVK